MTRCHVCKRPCTHEVEPAFGELPAVTEPDVWTVAIRNGLYVDACFSCWFMWPDRHKLSGRIEEYADVTPLDWAERLVATVSPRSEPISAGAAAALENARIAVELWAP